MVLDKISTLLHGLKKVFVLFFFNSAIEGLIGKISNLFF